MPLEFALRPRIRMRVDPAPAPSRRSRMQVPRFALPAVLYWAAVGGICYGIIRLHDAPTPEPTAEARELATPELPGSAQQEHASAAAPDVPAREPALEQAPAPVPADEAPPVPAQQAPLAAAPQTRSLGDEVSGALLADRLPEPSRQPTGLRRALGSQQDEPAPRAALDSAPATDSEPRRAPAAQRGGGSSLPSCEAAAAAAVQDLDFASSDRSADLPSEAIAGVLENGAWLSSCSVPNTTKLDVCVAIKGGRVMAATVTSRPSDPALEACVKQRAAALQFPYSPRVDVARTRF